MATQSDVTFRIRGHRAQLEFKDCTSVPYVGFVGGRGSGKSYALAMRLLEQSLAERGLYGMYAPTFPLLNDTIQRVFLEVAKPFIREFNQGKNIIRMSNGSEILCRSLDDPERARGPSLRGAVWDEASLCKQEAFDILIACLRYQGKQGWLACGFTPKGISHWTALVFNDPKRPDAKCFHSTTMDNPFNPPEFASTLSRQYTRAFAQQEIGGAFISISGGLMRREWFRIVDQSPPLASVVRFWDMASTPSTGSNNPDWTAGAKVGRTRDGRWHIIDVRHARLSPAANEMLVEQTASTDGHGCKVGMEEEGGSSGKSLADHYRRTVLTGYGFYAVRPTGDKITRAMPWMAAAEAGNVSLLKGDWCKDFLDEVEGFGQDCDHDDQVDAVSGAVNMQANKTIHPHVGADYMNALVDNFKDLLDRAGSDVERQELQRMIAQYGREVPNAVAEGALVPA